MQQISYQSKFSQNFDKKSLKFTKEKIRRNRKNCAVLCVCEIERESEKSENYMGGSFLCYI